MTRFFCSTIYGHYLLYCFWCGTHNLPTFFLSVHQYHILLLLVSAPFFYFITLIEFHFWRCCAFRNWMEVYIKEKQAINMRRHLTMLHVSVAYVANCILMAEVKDGCHFDLPLHFCYQTDTSITSTPDANISSTVLLHS